MKTFIILVLWGCGTSSLYAQQELSTKDRQSIMAVMQMQEDAWNQGDVAQFMTGYWKSDQTVFNGASGPVFGWDKVLDRYLKAYPDRKAMGALAFEITALYPVAKKVALMTGKFNLTRESGDLEGYFTLVWKKINKQWLMLSDHTSAASDT